MAGKKRRRTVRFTDNGEINRLLTDVVSSVRDFTENQLEQIQTLTQIGAALSAEHHIERLLEVIVDEARKLTNADGGTLYVLNDDKKRLEFAIVQNNSLGVRMGGTAGEITWPPIELYSDDGTPNHANVSSYAALSGEVANISDVYQTEKFNFEGTRQFDSETGYRSESMLVVPMHNHENDIIGILQLLNAQDPEKMGTIPFSAESQKLTESLASQAAIAHTNSHLIIELQNLFESFVRTIATAIDEKSPYTGDHGRRVVEITMMIAGKINDAAEGSFADIVFDKDEMNELRIAAWLHDVGKVAVPEHVMDKPAKLKTVCDRIELLKTRIEVMKRDVEIEYLKRLHGNGNNSHTLANNKSYRRRIKKLDDEFSFLASINQGAEFMSDEDLERLGRIARRKWTMNGDRLPLITDDELENLAIRKGTLTDDERTIINSHAEITYKMLSQMPFPKKLKNVPIYASSHHECINGAGYPRGLMGDDISLQARIIALADAFEALTAHDRPYREANTLSQAIRILGFMVKDGHLDKDLFDLFMKELVYLDYAERELDPSQIDEVEA